MLIIIVLQVFSINIIVAKLLLLYNNISYIVIVMIYCYCYDILLCYIVIAVIFLLSP